MTEKILLALNKLFPLPVHPFNLQNDGVKTYAMWQNEERRHHRILYDKSTPRTRCSATRMCSI